MADWTKFLYRSFSGGGNSNDIIRSLSGYRFSNYILTFSCNGKLFYNIDVDFILNLLERKYNV